MKIEFKETEYGFIFNMIPETVAEVGIISRLANKTKREPARIYTSLSNDSPFCTDREPWCAIQHDKLSISKRKTFFTNAKNK